MLLPYLYYTLNVMDRLISGEPPVSIHQRMEDLDALIKQLGHIFPSEKAREKL
jgi:hypothetical protein